MSYLDKIYACNDWEPAVFVPFIRRGERLGSLRRSAAEALRRWPTQFRVTETAVEWVETPDDFEGCTLALAEVSRGLVDEGVIPYLHGEQYPVTAGGREAARCLVDRACAPSSGCVPSVSI